MRKSMFNKGRSRFLPTGPRQFGKMGVGVGLYFRLLVRCWQQVWPGFAFHPRTTLHLAAGLCFLVLCAVIDISAFPLGSFGGPRLRVRGSWATGARLLFVRRGLEGGVKVLLIVPFLPHAQDCESGTRRRRVLQLHSLHRAGRKGLRHRG